MITQVNKVSVFRHWGMLCLLLLLNGCVTGNFDMAATPLQIALGQPDQSSGFKPVKPDLKKVKGLVEGGADVNFVNGWGAALHVAARQDTPEFVSYLIDHGANVNLKDSGGITPLMWAAKMGKLENVELLVEKGADVNAVASVGEWTPLSEAAYSGRVETVNYIISKGADVSRQALGRAYLEAASGMAYSTNADHTDAHAKQGKYPHDYVAILNLLTSKGADINSVDKYGQTALHMPAAAGNPQVVRYFLKAGVDPKISAPNLGTPLEWAKKNKENLLKMQETSTHPATVSDKDWNLVKKSSQERASRIDEVVAILTPVSNSPATSSNTASSDTATSSAAAADKFVAPHPSSFAPPEKISCAQPIKGTGGKYKSPFTAAGQIAPWAQASGGGKDNGSEIAASAGGVVGGYAAKQVLSFIPFVGGMIGSKAGEYAGRAATTKTVGAELPSQEVVKLTSDISFKSVNDLAVYMYAKCSSHPAYPQVLALTQKVYPELKEAYVPAIEKASKKRKKKAH